MDWAYLLEKRGFSWSCVPVVPVVPINFEVFAGIYDYLGDWGWFALFVLICLSICVIYLLVNPKVVNQVNKILTLYTPRLWGRIRRNQAI